MSKNGKPDPDQPKKGRPPYQPEDVRNQNFKVYVTGAQLNELTSAARLNGQTLSTFVLNCALHVADKLSERGGILKKKQDKILKSFKVKARQPDGHQANKGDDN